MATGTILLPIPAPYQTCGISYEANAPMLLFDAATVEYAYWKFRMPSDYASGLTLKIQYSMASATSGNVDFDAEVMAITPGDSADAATDSYASANSANQAVAGTAGYVKEVSITMSNDDGLAAGDWFKLRFSRDADDGTNDTATGDCEVHALTLEYTTS